ncbi:UNVERIFIED_CONTAM: LINE-1 retrotransposable element O protein [Sesamum calycinum]|uniref:LINE-1 retrotransposable element O protein n=1 Tax=Sesamum calycinum TaxID=2727403 RepID=A0AAW2RBH2_9LAMI
MNLLMWNCQGLGGPWTIRSLGNFIRDYHPALIFLAETKCSSRRIDLLKRGFDMFGFSVDSRSKGGGLALLWRKSVDVVLQCYSHNHIDVFVRLNENQDWWRFTGLYGEPETAKREATWRLLSQLHTQSVRPWLENSSLGANHHSSPGTIRERLDRACTNWGWTQLFPNVSVLHFSANCSDHSALLVKLDGHPALNLRGFRPWRFEAVWLQTEQCANIVAENWRCPLSSNLSMALFERLEACQQSLTRWSKESLHNDRQRINQLERTLTTLFSGILTPERLEEASALRQELENRAAREETVWRQRSKALWLWAGDRNTSFFHRQSSQRFQTNLISRIKDSSGEWVEDVDGIRRLVDASMAEDLLQPFTAIEVTSALFSMAPLKSPGPDGMSPIFFQKFWHIVQTDVTSCALNLLNSLVMPPSLNATNIVLILKCKHPEYLTQFRPISLCNVVYKIASKAIANRLKVLLDRIISPFQSAFVPGRLITDNVLLAFELNHFLNTKTKGGQGYMVLKLDVSKAYDKVEWAFLKQVMLKLGFPPPPFCASCHPLCLVGLLFFYVRWLSIWLSHPRKGSPWRGPSFSVPISSLYRIFLFTYTKGGVSRPYPGNFYLPGAPCISHLLFADDTLIFRKASLSSVRAIKDLLEIYRRASGQEINFHKSSVAFSRNTPEALSIGLASVLNIRKENKMELYLGLPSRVVRSKRELFSMIRDRIWKRITGWNDKFLSQAGKEVLIKSIVQAIPSYAMSCFKLPVTLLTEIQGMISNFWWHNRGQRTIHWLSWQRLCDSKLQGGLGFRRLHLFNLAMLAKNLWRIFTSPERPLCRVLRARYFPHDLINQEIGDWNSIVIQNNFLPLDCEVILGIPLGRTVCEDLLIWHYSTNGLFSVRSAYHLACSMEESPCSSRNLSRRIPGSCFACPFCLEDAEDVMHCLKVCPFARQVWGLSNLPAVSIYQPAMDVFAWFRAVLSRLDKREFEYFLCICWALWWCRNSKLVQGNCLDPDHLICFVVRHLEAFHQQSFVPPPPHQLISPPHWQYPPPNFIKLNFDGAVFDRGKETGIGVVARNDRGDCVGWLSLRLAKTSDGPLAEAFAAREAVLFAINRGWQNVVLEGDCATLITKLLPGLRDFSAIGSITLDIQNLISYFQFSRFSFVQRSCNSVAHVLAKLALGSASGESNIPAPAAHFVMLDKLATT